MATYNVFTASREALQRDIEKYAKYLDILQKIRQARITLDEARKMNALKMIEQRRESDALLRIQMEQKMHLMQQQQIELECYKQSMMEKRLRELTTDVEIPANSYSMPQQAPQNPNYYPPQVSQPYYDVFQPQMPQIPQESTYHYPVQVPQDKFQSMPPTQQPNISSAPPNTTQSQLQSDFDELIIFDPIPKNT